jgi:hypothetical protein
MRPSSGTLSRVEMRTRMSHGTTSRRAALADVTISFVTGRIFLGFDPGRQTIYTGTQKSTLDRKWGETPRRPRATLFTTYSLGQSLSTTLPRMSMMTMTSFKHMHDPRR